MSDPYGFCDANGNPSLVPNGVSSIGGQAGVAGVDVAGLDCANPDDPAFTVVGVGANGFPGYSPAFSDKYERDSYAVYGDLSADINDALFLQAAVRFEDYSDFGNETVGKIAGRWLVNDQFAIRGSVGTGFRAPTPGQQGTTNVSTRLPDGVPVATGLFPASGDIAAALGASPLQAETSTSFTVGFTADLDKLSLTVDFYSIDIDDRFRAISTLPVSTDPDSGDAYDNFLALDAAGVAGAATIGGVFYFTNAFDTNTTGVDVVASYPIEWGNGQDTALQLAVNWNESSLESDASEFLNDEDRYDFENRDPNIRWNLQATHSISDLSFMGRVRYYGESDNQQWSSGELVGTQTFGSLVLFDLEANYQINDNWRVSIGGRNIFDDFPDQLDVIGRQDQCCGRIYDSGSIVPWQGGYYFGRVSVSF